MFQVTQPNITILQAENGWIVNFCLPIPDFDLENIHRPIGMPFEDEQIRHMGRVMIEEVQGDPVLNKLKPIEKRKMKDTFEQKQENVFVFKTLMEALTFIEKKYKRNE